MSYDLIWCVSQHGVLVKSWRRVSNGSLGRHRPQLECLIIFVII